MLPERKQAEHSAKTSNSQKALSSVEAINIDEKPQLRFGWTVLLVGFVGFLLWAGLVPLDQGAPMTGTVVVSGNTKSIQHPYGGVIDRIHVREGSVVKEGQALISFNDVRSDAALEVARTQWISAVAIKNRLSAELAGAGVISFDSWLNQNAQDVRVKEAVQLQNDLFQSRRSSYQSELRALRETELALNSSLKNMEAGFSERKEQLRLSTVQVEGFRTMESQGYLARNKLLEMERQTAALSAAVSDDQASIARVRGQLGELRQRIALVNSQFTKETQTQLTEVQRTVDELDEKLRTADYDNQYRELKSPVDGVVTNVQVFTEGGVVQAGVPLMQIVPKGIDLEINAQLDVQLIDKARVGMEVMITFPAFNMSTTPQLIGEVHAVGADRVVDERSGVPYYIVKVKVKEGELAKLKGLSLQPGMPAEMLVKTGERTLLSYLVKPIKDHLSAALKEE